MALRSQISEKMKHRWTSQVTGGTGCMVTGVRGFFLEGSTGMLDITTVAPEPASLVMFGSGILGLGDYSGDVS